MPKGKAASSSESSRKMRPALSPEARENQLVSLAVDLAEKKLREGTASSQVITHYLKFLRSRKSLSRLKHKIFNPQNVSKNSTPMLLTLCVIILVPGAMKMSVRTYTELISLPTLEERFRYLKLDGKIGEATFGFQRWLNQEFYHSSEWLSFRDDVIIRDNGCDLGIAGHEIFGPVLIHHINPITYEDIINRNPCVFDLENVICTQLKTHNAIHYGDESILILKPVQRSRNDTCPWRKN